MPAFPLSGSPELAERINHFDWESTSLGPISAWPASLITAVGILLGSRFPMQLLWGPDYIHLYNDAYVPIASAKHPAALGRPGAAIWPEIWATTLEILEQVRSTGEPTWAEDLLLLLDEGGRLEERYFTFSYGPIRGDSGSVEGIFIAVSETTRRVIGERRLRTVRDLGTALGGLTREATVLSAAAEVVEANPADIPFALCYLFERARAGAKLAWAVRLSPGQAAGVQPTGAVEWADSAIWPVEELQRERVPVVVPLACTGLPPIIAPPWGVMVEAALALPLALPGEVPIGFLIAGLSPRLRFDEAYREFLERLANQVAVAVAGARAHARAEQEVEIRDSFLSIAAHELKTPLTPMIGKLQLLRRRLGREQVDPRALRDLELVEAEASRLVTMIDLLLDVSYLRSGQLPIARLPVELGELVRRLVAELEPALQSHTLVCELPDGPVLVAGDPIRLEQVLRNLVGNAVKYSPQGGKITLTLQTQAATVALSVADQGIGIAPEALPRIFERYYRGDPVGTGGVGGFGIGLYVVHELVRAHGGDITVESTVGVGSRFTVTLPQYEERPGGHGERNDREEG
ncbi:MAG: hypothetical protein OHK0015_51190 [Chloroflexi bacterium OHK40]